MREWIARDREAAREYIRSRVSVGEGGCWIWQRGKRKGYGQFGLPLTKATTRAHVAAYEAFVGPVPDGMLVRHRCDVRACCNPAHLETGTHVDNMRDRYERGRCARLCGERNPGAKLSKHQIDVIHELRAEGLLLREIAAVVGCSLQNVSYILNGKTWSHAGSKS